MGSLDLHRDRNPPWQLLSAVCALGYFATIGWSSFAGSLPMKILAILCLALTAWSAGSRSMSVALTVFAIGDGLLDDPRKSQLFVPGMLTFVAGHLIYAFCFSRYWDRPLRIWENQRVLLTLVVAYCVGFTGWMQSSLGALTVPGLVYASAICLMACSAILARPRWPVLAGLAFFMVSDSLMALGKFKGRVPFEPYFVWITYYLAQLGISQQSGEAKPGRLLR